MSLEVLGAFPLPDTGGIGHGGRVKRQVAGVANLTTDGGVAQEAVEGFGIGGHDGGLEVLDVLADAEDLARQAELLLGGFPGEDLGLCRSGAEEVPGVEAGKVLDRAQELVAADGGGDEAQVVRYGGVVGECVDDHCGTRVEDWGGMGLLKRGGDGNVEVKGEGV